MVEERGTHHTPLMSILQVVERCTLQVHIAGGGKKYPLDLHSSGGGKGGTLHVYMAGKGNGYTLRVHTAGGGNVLYTPCTSILRVVYRGTPCMSIFVYISGGERDTYPCMFIDGCCWCYSH